MHVFDRDIAFAVAIRITVNEQIQIAFIRGMDIVFIIFVSNRDLRGSIRQQITAERDLIAVKGAVAVTVPIHRGRSVKHGCDGFMQADLTVIRHRSIRQRGNGESIHRSRCRFHREGAGDDIQFVVCIVDREIIAADHIGSGGGNIRIIFDIEVAAHSDNIIADRCADRVIFRVERFARRNGLIVDRHSQFRLFHGNGLFQNRTVRQHIIRAETVDSRRDGVFARVVHCRRVIVCQRYGQIIHFLAVAIKHLHDHSLICTVVGIISGDRTPIQRYFRYGNFFIRNHFDAGGVADRIP